MRKSTPMAINWIIVFILASLLILGLTFVLKEKMEPGESDPDALILDSNITKEGMIKEPKIEEEIIVNFLSANYLTNKEYLIRVEVGGEQVGIVYFDEKGEIRFDGDREKFEDAIFKAFDARRAK